jgi:hypothetical protein
MSAGHRRGLLPVLRRIADDTGGVSCSSNNTFIALEVADRAYCFESRQRSWRVPPLTFERTCTSWSSYLVATEPDIDTPEAGPPGTVTVRGGSDRVPTHSPFAGRCAPADLRSTPPGPARDLPDGSRRHDVRRRPVAEEIMEELARRCSMHSSLTRTWCAARASAHDSVSHGCRTWRRRRHPCAPPPVATPGGGR